MSMFDDVLGFGRTDFVNESVEPELANDTLESAQDLAEGCDPMEFMIETAYNNEINMRNIDAAIMCEEYAYLKEHGTEMVYEAGTILTILSKAKDAVLKVWGNIQTFIKNQIAAAKDTRIQLFLEKYEKLVLSGNYRVKIKGYKDLTSTQVREKTSRKFTDIANAAKELSAIDVNGKFDEEKVKSLIPEKSEKGFWIIDRSDKKEEISVSAKDAIAELKTGIKLQQSMLKTNFDNSKKIVSDQLKAIKKMERDAKKDKDVDNETVSNIHKAVAKINNLSSVLASVNRESVKLMNIVKAQSKAAILTAVKDNKDSDPDEIDEGAIIASSNHTHSNFVGKVEII